MTSLADIRGEEIRERFGCCYCGGIILEAETTYVVWNDHTYPRERVHRACAEADENAEYAVSDDEVWIKECEQFDPGAFRCAECNHTLLTCACFSDTVMWPSEEEEMPCR